jgi:hypothetical protein
MAKRKPGRPKGSKNKASKASKATRKTAGRRGRPPGSKNRKRAEKAHKTKAGRGLGKVTRRPRNTGVASLEARIKAYTRAPSVIEKLEMAIQTEAGLHDAKLKKMVEAHDKKMTELKKAEREAREGHRALGKELMTILSGKPAPSTVVDVDEKPVRRGRPASGSESLPSRLIRLLVPKGTPFDISNIKQILKQDGWITKSENPDGNLYQALRLPEDEDGRKVFERTGQGIYVQVDYDAVDGKDVATETGEVEVEEEEEGEEEEVVEEEDDEEDEEDDLVDQVSGELGTEED